VYGRPFRRLEGAEAVAGPGAGPAVLHLVDCSLLVPPRAGPDGRSRYGMLETLRAYGAGLLAGAAEQDGAAAALAGDALRLARQAGAGLQSGDGEVAAARWLDAEDATMRQALAWAVGRTAEAAGDARRALALAREIGDPVGELLALVGLSFEADYAGHHDEAVRLARQAGQIAAGIPGSLARMCSSVLTSVLADAGDLAEAARVGAACLARARDAGDLWNQAVLLPRVVELDLRAGRTSDAATHLREGLHLAVRAGSWYELLADLSQCGNLCAATGRAAEALTLWAACAAVGRPGRLTEPPWFVPRWEEQPREARLALGPGRARAAEDRGAAMSITTAAEYALMLTDPGPPQPTAPDPGKLSARERELVTLVAQGRTNAQIAAQLYISARTVSSHLERIRDKTGYRRRADLTRLALSEGLV
jgi:DNA-binding CsgD family transcriptional regulator